MRPSYKIHQLKEQSDDIHLDSLNFYLFEKNGQKSEGQIENHKYEWDDSIEFFGQFYFGKNEQDQNKYQLPLLQIELKV